MTMCFMPEVNNGDIMSYETKFPDWRQRIEEASDKTQSASAAAAFLGIKYDTYKRYAKKYGCFKTNQAGKGIDKPKITGKIPLDLIFAGNYPEYQSNKLRLKLIKEDIFPHICSNCLTEEWLGNQIPLELN